MRPIIGKGSVQGSWGLGSDANRMLHFSEKEYGSRCKALADRIAAIGLDGILLFKQESMYYLTGYDTMGYITFQCMYFGADGTIFLLTRMPDKRAAAKTSNIQDVHIYDDGPNVNPAEELQRLVSEYAPSGQKISLGIEYHSFGLRYNDALRVNSALSPYAELHDASGIVDELRLIKSDEELRYIERAASLADEALVSALDTAKPGVSEGDLLAAMQGSIFRGNGDYSASRWIVGSGDHSILVRHFGAHHNVIQESDQIQLEFGAAYLHYHACLFHTIYVGPTVKKQQEMRRTAIAALDSAIDACRPGHHVQDMFENYSREVDASGLSKMRLNACGYSLGATFPPTWMDGSLICRGNSREIREGMVFFPHMVLVDSDTGFTGCAGETIVVEANGPRRLSAIEHKLYEL